MKIGRKELLTLASGIFGVGSVIVGLLSKKDETDEAAEKAADIVMYRLEQKKKEED